MKKIFSLLFVCLLLVVACEEDYEHTPITIDGEAPAGVENVQFTPVYGGFRITYDLPKDSDLLYVKAVYNNSKGEQVETRSSGYTNKIEILGFGDTEEKTITLIAVDRSENASKPVSFTGNPLTPPVKIIEQNLAITQDFGGAKFHWVNEEKTPISISLFAENDKKELEEVRTIYTSQSETSFSLRGYESVEQKFAAVIRDRYDNFSDTIYPATPNKMIIPLFEERLDKKQFKKLILANDTNWDAWEGDYTNFYDDDMKSIVHTQGDRPNPQIFSIDLGVVVKLSRFTLYQRLSHGSLHAYTHGNPKKYTVYGAKELPADPENLENWILLRECESIKPSGLPIGQNTDEDIDHLNAGDEYTFDEAPEIRYFRLAVHETWDGAGYINASEITFWGNIIN
ncbi:protein of unknown function [Arenibacter nanhaiticus]|uniref:F5/8 type C domain-containing protein n=1 Tax=Arenibacter nanhaiticus TaxID=558155 RepID=A0A1M6IFC9_9FLAO|nr:DUF5000 domain-containing lipoprotein [Arenibacter nanhaiticus]SHJ33177.1 protein of unknown function [Arenibacter nanhaiticus]